LLPFLIPNRYRKYLLEGARLPDGTLRLFGLMSLLLGWIRG